MSGGTLTLRTLPARHSAKAKHNISFNSEHRRDQGVSGDQVSIMVDGVQVALPSYEEAVYGSTGNCIPPSDSRVQIVLSEGAGQSGAREMQQPPPDQVDRSCFAGEDEVPGHSGLCEAGSSHHSEAVLVHQATSSSWVAGMSTSRSGHKEAPDLESSDVQSLLSLTSSEDYTDGKQINIHNMHFHMLE